MMEETLLIAGFWSNLFFAARILLTVAVFVAATAVIIASGGTALLALGIGVAAGAATYWAMGFLKPEDDPSIIPPPPPEVSTEFNISIDFSPGDPHTVPFECIIHKGTTVTTRQGGKSSSKSSSDVRHIHSSNGEGFEIEFNRYLREELKSGLDKDHKLRSITIYEEPFPGETPLDMIYYACKDQFPKEQFPDVEIKTTQEAYHE